MSRLKPSPDGHLPGRALTAGLWTSRLGKHPGRIVAGLFLLVIGLVAGCSVSQPAAGLPTLVPTVPPAAVLPISTVAIHPTYTRSATAVSQPNPTRSIATATFPPCRESGQVLTGSYPSSVAGQASGYRIYLPPCYDESGPAYPTLYLLHGNIHTAAQWDDLGIDEAAEEAILTGRMPPLLIIMPEGGRLANESSGGPHSFEGQILSDLIPYIEENYCAWPAAEGRAIGGLSRGGYWALEIAFRNPLLFASVGGHSAALLDTEAGPELNPQYTGLINELGNLRVYLDIGDDDYLLPNILRLHEEMATAGVAHTWQLNSGRHEDAYWREHLGEYLTWYSEGWAGSDFARPGCGGQNNGE